MTPVLNGTEIVTLTNKPRNAPKLNVVARRPVRRERRAIRTI